MAKMSCNYQQVVTPDDRQRALLSPICHDCGCTAEELRAAGQTLEVCGEEFSYDLATGQRVLRTLALCPACHAEHHRDDKNRHNPCQISARRSLECGF